MFPLGGLFLNAVSSNSSSASKGDVLELLKWGTVGFAALGASQAVGKYYKDSQSPEVGTRFRDDVEFLPSDQAMSRDLLKLQEYRDINTPAFRSIVQNLDRIWGMEFALKNDSLIPKNKEKMVLFTHFKVAMSRLKKFQQLVKTELGTDHGLLVNTLAKRIYFRSQQHVFNCLRLCAEFQPTKLIERAQQDITSAMDAYRTRGNSGSGRD
jgi:hypothetical protein